MILIKINKRIVVTSESCLNKNGYNFIHFFIGKHIHRHKDTVRASLIENRLKDRGFIEV